MSIILGDSPNLWEVLTPFAVFLGGPLTQKKGKLETADSVVNLNSSWKFIETAGARERLRIS